MLNIYIYIYTYIAYEKLYAHTIESMFVEGKISSLVKQNPQDLEIFHRTKHNRLFFSFSVAQRQSAWVLQGS